MIAYYSSLVAKEKWMCQNSFGRKCDDFLETDLATRVGIIVLVLTHHPDFDTLGDLPTVDADTAHDMFLKYEKLAFNRCRDLLEIRLTPEGASSPTELGIFRYEVDFLHRSVRYFLREYYLETLQGNAVPDSR